MAHPARKGASHTAGRTFVVLGAGAMGRIAARDLTDTASSGSVLIIADVNLGVAAKVARSLPHSRRVRIRSARADAGNIREVESLLKTTNAFAILNATHHRFNSTVMKAALAARAHYCDLGGLFYQTRAQLREHHVWKRADRLALLGIGAAPGIVNVLARSSADTMERVREIHIYVGGIDRARGQATAPFGVSYSVRALFEEASQDAAVLRGGRVTFEPPMSGARRVRFPAPVGTQTAVFTLHSEIATLPLTYRGKGIRACTFRIAFPPNAIERLALLRELGLFSTTPVRISGANVIPGEFVALVAESAAPARESHIPDEYEILRVVVRGHRNGKTVEDTIDCHVQGNRKWRIGSDIDTGCPPSIAMQMLARGEITTRGVVPPEQAIPAKDFIRELRARGMRIERRTRRWDARPVRRT